MEKESQPLNQFLKLISFGEELMIEASDGQATINEFKESFKASISFNFQYWGLSKPGVATPETLLEIYELAADATFQQMFASLNADWDKLIVSQSQIINFCKKYPNWLHPGVGALFFLIKENNEYFVVSVVVYGVLGLGFYIDCVKNSVDILSSGNRHRLVIPKPLPLAS